MFRSSNSSNICKYLSLLIVLCFICVLPVSSMAAAKKGTKRKTTKQSDKVEQILKRYPPASSINANAIRNILKTSGNDKILAVEFLADEERNDGRVLEVISAKDGSSKRTVLGWSQFGEEISNEVYSVSFHMPSSTLVFYDAYGNFLSTFSDAKGLAGLKRILASGYKFDKNPSSPLHETAIMPLIWH